MVATRKDYPEHAVEAARSVLLELAHLFRSHGDDIVVVGGWVPELLLSSEKAPHIGSTDIDLALDHRALQEPRYRSLLAMLTERGYRQSDNQPFIFHRSVKVGQREVIVQVDFLAGEYAGTRKSHRTQEFEDMRARKARGCDLVFEMNTEVEIQGTLPEGGKDQAAIRVASVVPFIVMKGMALADRLKEKDAWDIYYCLQHFPGGVEALVEMIRPHISHGLVREGLEKIAEKFASPEHVGPKFVADFEELTDPEGREFVQRDSFERVDYLLQTLDLKRYD